MSDAEKMKNDYEAIMRQLGPVAGVRPNDLQADPWAVPCPGGPAGYTMRDMLTPRGTEWPWM